MAPLPSGSMAISAGPGGESTALHWPAANGSAMRQAPPCQTMSPSSSLEELTSELQPPLRISYAGLRLKNTTSVYFKTLLHHMNQHALTDFGRTHASPSVSLVH